jgi:hypothetical protein
MSVFNPNIPAPTDRLSVSQGQIQQNFSKSDTSFGTDHYKFSDATVNNGKHNLVTTPAVINSPPDGLPPATAANEPRFYAYEEPTSNLGVIQYSRGPNNAVPTPLTSRQSASTATVINAASFITVFDFTNLTRAFCTLYVIGTGTLANQKKVTSILWNGSAFAVDTLVGATGSSLTVVSSGSTIRINNPTGAGISVYWTLELHRVS